MSKEIKMSDMFDLPLVGSESPFVRDSSGNCVIYAHSKLNDISELERISRAKHAVHAINNHDRLVEENAKLREALDESNEVFRRNLSKYFYKDEASMLSVLEKNKQLLSKLVGE